MDKTEQAPTRPASMPCGNLHSLPARGDGDEIVFHPNWSRTPTKTMRTMKRTTESSNSMHVVRRTIIRAATAGVAVACLALGVNAAHAQSPVITNVFPDGAHSPFFGISCASIVW